MNKILKLFFIILIMCTIFSTIAFATENNSLSENEVIVENTNALAEDKLLKTENITSKNEVSDDENFAKNEEKDNTENELNIQKKSEKLSTDQVQEVVYANGAWRMAINGVVDYNYEGIGTNANGTWVIEKGKVTFNFKGIYKDAKTGKSYLVEGSKVQTGKTDVMNLLGKWIYVEKGELRYDYNGIAKNSNGTWVIENGIVTFNYKGSFKANGKAYIAEGSKVYATINENANEVVCVNGIWRMAINGVVDYNYEGIGTNANGTWVLEKGKVTFSYKGIYKDLKTGKTYLAEGSKVQTSKTDVMYVNGKWTYVEKGVLRYDYNGIAKNANGTWVIENGIVTFNYKGSFKANGKAYIAEGSKVYATINENANEVVCVNGVWRMAINGAVDYNYEGIGTNANGTWVLEKGKVTFEFKGIYKDAKTGKSYLVEGSKVQTGKTDVMYVNGKWTYVEKGVLRYDYRGIAKNSNGTWLIENGIVTFSYNGRFEQGDMVYTVVGSKVTFSANKTLSVVMNVDGVWRMVDKGEVLYNYEGIGTNENGIWVLEKGKVTFSYKGIYKDLKTGKSYLVEGSKVQTSKTDVMNLSGKWTYVEKGVLRYDYNGIAQNANGTWVIENGIVTFNYKGSFKTNGKAYIAEGSKVYAIINENANEVVCINNIWRMAINGVVDYDYTGFGTNASGTWLLENGKVTFEFTGTYKNDKNIYVIEKSKVQLDKTTVMNLDGAWTYVEKGIIRYDYNGIAQNEKGTWIIESGIVTFNYKGTFWDGEKGYISEGSKVYKTVTPTTNDVMSINGIWRMVKNGEVDYEYNGLGTNANGTWVIENGKVTFTFTGNYVDEEGNIYGVKKSEVREILKNVKYPGTMCIDEPASNIKYTAGALNVSGWELSEEENTIVKFYMNGKYVVTAKRKEREDVLKVHKDNYGGREKNPKPGFYYAINTSALARGTHTLKVVVYTSDGKTIIQSREVNFTINYIVQRSGIDVSQHQGTIDWGAVKASGVEFAIIRVGYYLDSSRTFIKDQYFDYNYNACKNAGIAVGGYFYSYAFNSEEATREAQACLSAIAGKGFEMPIFLDVEDNILKNAVASGRTNVNELTNASITFCDIMNNNGYKAGVYASKSFFNTYLDTGRLERYNIWLAHYTTSTDYSGKYDLWQYSSSGSMSGIIGNVDLDWCFTRYY